VMVESHCRLQRSTVAAGTRHRRCSSDDQTVPLSGGLWSRERRLRGGRGMPLPSTPARSATWSTEVSFGVKSRSRGCGHSEVV
jgi:hypothetical protein